MVNDHYGYNWENNPIFRHTHLFDFNHCCMYLSIHLFGCVFSKFVLLLACFSIWSWRPLLAMSAAPDGRVNSCSSWRLGTIGTIGTIGMIGTVTVESLGMLATVISLELTNTYNDNAFQCISMHFNASNKSK